MGSALKSTPPLFCIRTVISPASTSRKPRHSFGVLTSHVISQLRFPSSEIHWSVFLSHTVNVRDVQTHCEFLNKSLFESKQTTMGSKISNAPERKFCSFFYAFKIKRGCEEGSKVVEEGKVGTGLHDSEQDCVLPWGLRTPLRSNTSGISKVC